jgi:hypothetical protein
MPGKRECLAVETARRVRCGCGTCARCAAFPSIKVVLCRAQRRFPPPWTVEEQAACFAVRDSNGQQIYFEDETGRRSAAKLLTRDQARRIAGDYRLAAL